MSYVVRVLANISDERMYVHVKAPSTPKKVTPRHTKNDITYVLVHGRKKLDAVSNSGSLLIHTYHPNRIVV